MKQSAGCLVAAALALLGMAAYVGALAQEPAPLPRIVIPPAPPESASSGPGMPVLPGPPPIVPAALAVPVQEPGPGTVPIHWDPVQPPPGWFGAFEIAVIAPHLTQRLAAPVLVHTITGSFVDEVRLPGTNLDWTGSGMIALGFRYPESLAGFQASFRALSTDGEAVLLNFDPIAPASLVTQLDLNALDLDYISTQTSLGWKWDVRWLVGVRLADVFFDNEALGFLVRQRSRNYFIGVGPHLGLDLWRTLAVPGLAFYGRIEASVLAGRVRQRFEEDLAVWTVPVGGGQTKRDGSQAVPTLSVQLGLTWTPIESWRWFRITGGYQFEQWWYVDRLDDTRADLYWHGLFLRCEWRF